MVSREVFQQRDYFEKTSEIVFACDQLRAVQSDRCRRGRQNAARRFGSVGIRRITV